MCRLSPLPPTFSVGDDHIGNDDDDDHDDNVDDNNVDDDDDDDDGGGGNYGDITSSPSFLHSLVKEGASAG